MPELLGPFGLVVGAVVALGVLWREHLRADAEDRRQRDDAIAEAREQTAVTKRLADALEARNRRDAGRRRREDQ